MFRFVVLALTVSCALAAGYGGGYGGFAAKGLGLGLGNGLGLRSAGFGGLGLGLGLNKGYARAVPLGPINAAIQSTRSYELVPVALPYEAAVPQTIDVPPNVQPVNIIFRTQSSPLNLQQIHTPGAPQYESTRSEDAPSVLTHDNYRTVVQQYNEVIQPIRKIVQRVNPVIENVHTVVAKGEARGLGLVAQGYDAPLVGAPLVGAPLVGAPLLGKAGYR